MVNYTGQFSGYFPNKPAYGREPATYKPNYSYNIIVDRGLYKDVSGTTPDVVQTNQVLSAPETLSGDSGVQDEMCIAFGGNTDPARRRVDQSGILQAGPVGLGYLAATGVMDDLRTLYCPSWNAPANYFDSMGTSYAMYYSGAQQQGQVNSLPMVKALGGFSGEYLTHGNYYRAGMALGASSGNAWYIGSGAVGAQSHYAYRLHGVSTQMGHQHPDRKFAAHYSKPLVVTETGCPLFKTDLRLRGRSYVTDGFLRSYPMVNNNVPGYGQYHHLDGYNVLYGDGHSRWYSDIEQRIQWLTCGPKTNGKDRVPPDWTYDSMRESTLASLDQEHSVMSGAGGDTNGRSMVYHIFDEAAGIDVGTTPLPQ